MPTSREYQEHIDLQEKLIEVQGKTIDLLTTQLLDMKRKLDAKG